tara:strand:+ start:94 stop:1104 length:1011 start_codon:yes stop_codon:yes gene_type:complete
MSKLTENIESNIKKTRNIKESSLRTYMSSLKTLKKQIEPQDKTGLVNINFLKDFDKVMNRISEEKKITSKKNKLTAILVALNSNISDEESNRSEDNKLIDKYGKELKKLADKYMVFLKEQTKTPTQKENWIDYKDLIEVVNQLMKEVKHHSIAKKKELNKKEYDLLQQLVILRTYLDFPIRNDFADMKIITKKDFNKLPQNDQEQLNYLVLLPKNKKQFYINNFKNQKFMGSKKLDIQPKLNRIINIWLKYNNSGYFLTKVDRVTPMNPNNITKFLNKIFIKQTGKSISTSLIRHIIISHLMANEPTIKQNDIKKQQIEDTFLHTQDMNQLYRKID